MSPTAPRRCSISAAAPGCRAGADAAGFTTLDGTDITPEHAGEGRRRSASTAALALDPGDAPPPGYATIAAIGVVSLGAAPAGTLATLLDALAPGGHLGFSYNDATLADPPTWTALAAAQARAELLHDAYGPHLPAKDMGSRVYVLRKR
jgi:hypothetical protein